MAAPKPSAHAARPAPARAADRLAIRPATLRPRPDLLRSTALQAAFLAVLAVPAARPAAQGLPAPTALPTGGKVIAGQARITTTTGPGTAAMTVKQATGYGAYDWKSFDIGKSASVTYQVPTSQSISVNRVISPTSPSVIAGKLSSNGVVVVQNQSGVVFTQGAEVNVNTLIASAPGISDANARAGRLVFDQPARPGAKVENHGTITVAQTGLAALVAPQVANSGVIRAQMGRVVLAGAEAHTVDLYGDGLLSIDVTKQVTQLPAGPDGKAATALVTNTGTIIADGGTVLLTANAIDGLVQTLVTSGGTVRADTVATKSGARTGRVAVTAKGGDVVVTGTISASGTAPGTRGGRVEINAPARSVTLKPTARIAVSGKAGGGTAAIGTTIARAKGGPSVKAPTARNVVIESGARIAADATLNGAGGNVTVLSQGGTTRHRGEISARGGPQGGDGGFVETSGDTLALGGRVDVGAPLGAAGAILLDPIDLVVSAADTSKGADAPTKTADTITTKAGDGTTTLNPADILALTGNITIEALGTLTINTAVDTSATATIGNVTFKSGGNLAVNAPVTVDATKTLALNSGGGIALAANLTAGAIDLTAAAGVVQTTGSLTADALLSSGGITGSVALPSATNAIGTLGAITVTGGDLSLANATALAVTGAVALDAGRTASFALPGFSVTTGSIAITAGTVELAPLAGPMSLGAAAATELVLTQATLDKVAIGAGALQLGAASAGGATATSIGLNDALDATKSAATVRLVAGTGGITLTKGPVTAAVLDLNTTGGGVTDAGASIVADTLRSTNGIAGQVQLTATGHAIANLGPMAVSGGGLALRSVIPLAVTGKVQLGGDSTLTGPNASAKAIEVTGTLALTVADKSLALASGATGGITLSGTVDTLGGTLDLGPGTLGVSQSAGSIAAGTLVSTAGATGSVTLAQPANAVGRIGNFAVTGGDFILSTGTAVAVSGALSAANVAITSAAASASAISVTGSITANAGTALVTLVASDAGKGGIALSGDVTSTKGAIDLSAGAGGVLQSGGSLAAPGLLSTGGIAGTASLGSETNTLDGTGDIKVAGGDLLLATKTTLDVAGTLAVDPARTLALRINGLKLATGALAASGGTVEIAPLDGATMSLGKAAAAELTVTGANLARIASATLRLGRTAASATVADSLVVRDAFDATAAATAVLRLDAGASGITLDSAAALAANTLDLSTAGGGVNGVAGALATATRLQSSSGITGNTALADSVHAVGTLGDMTVAGTLSLATSLALDIAGQVSAQGATISSSAAGTAIVVSGKLAGTAGTTLALSASAATGGIALAGTLDASATGSLDLAAGSGGISQSKGTVVAGTLTGGTAGGLALTAGSNPIATIGKVTATGDVAIASTLATTVAGPVSAANVALSGSAANAKALDITGTIKATGTTSLAATDTAGGIALSGTVEAALIDLAAGTAGIVQTGGALLAATLRSTGDSGGSVVLTAPGNAIASLGPFAVDGASSFTLATTSALKVDGPLTSGSGDLTLATTAAGALDIAGTVATSKATIALRATNAAGAITLGAKVDAAGGTIDLVAGSGGVTQTAGTLNAQQLSSSAGIGGPVTLDAAGNTIATLGGIAVTSGGLTLVNGAALAVPGDVTLTSGTLLLDITDTTGAGLKTTGALSAANITLIGRGSTGALTLAGPVTTPGQLDLSVTDGGGVAAAGDLAAGTLRSTLGVVGGLTATSTGNTFAAIDALSVKGGDIALAVKAGTAVTVLGAVAVEAGKAITLQTDALSVITGSLTASTGTVSLIAPTAGISLGGASPGELVLLPTDLAGIATGTLNLASTSGAITLRGDLTTSAAASTLTLRAATGIVLESGTLTSAALRASTAAGGLTQTAGVLAATSLSSGTSGADAITGPVTLDNPANTIAALGPLVASGAVAVSSASLLTVADTIKAPAIALTGGAAGPALAVTDKGALTLTASGTIALATTDAAGTTSLAGTLDATASGTLLLSGSGTVAQTGGQIVAGTVAAPATIGAADLGQAANAVAALGEVAASGDVTLASSLALTAASKVAAGNLTLRSSATGTAIAVSSTDLATAAGGTITLDASNGASGITLSGTLNATLTGVLDVTAGTSGVTQTGGSATAGTLRSSGSVIGAVKLAQANNIAGLGPLSAGGAITLSSLSPIAIGAPVTSLTGATISLAATGMSFTGTGALKATGGTIELGPTTGTATFGLGTAGGDFALGSLANITASRLRIGQASSAGNANQAASITLADAVTPAVTTLELISAGAITQTKGGLAVPVLTATAAALDLGRAGNSIGTLGALTVTGDLAVANDAAIAVTGTLSAANITLASDAASATALDITGTLVTGAGGTVTLAATNAAGGIALSGTLDATATGIVDLSAGSAGITQSAGTITAGTLRSGAGATGAVLLDQAGNAVAALGDFAVTGAALTLRDSLSLDITGAVSAANLTLRSAGATLNLAASGSLAASGTALLVAADPAGGITLGGNVTAGILDIAAGTGGIGQTAGILKADTLRSTGGSTGTVALGETGNLVASLGDFAVTGADFSLTNAAALTVAGTLGATNVTLRGGAASANAIDVTGAIATAAGGTITLNATQIAGGLALSGTLDATATGAIDLSAGSLGIVQTGGSLTAATLRSAGSSTGAVSLGQAGNAIGALGDFAVIGAPFTLTVSIPLSITGDVLASGITIASAASGTAIALTGSLAAAGGTIALSATDTAGALSLGGLLSADTVSLTAGTGGIVQPGGGITAATLLATVTGGGAALDRPGNSIATLGDTTVTGSLALADSIALTVAGTVQAGTIALTNTAAGTAISVTGSLGSAAGGTIALTAGNAAGAIALGGTLDATATGTIDLSAGADVTQTAGTLAAGILRSTGGIGGNLTLPQPGNAIGALAALPVTGNADIASSIPLAVAGPVSAANLAVQTSAAGSTALSVTGSATAAGTMTLAATAADGGIALSGTVTAGVLDLGAGTGGISQPGGSIVAGTLRSTAGATGGVALDQSANAISSIGDFALADPVAFSVTTAVALDITGAVSNGTGGAVTLHSSAAGGIALSGSISTGTATLRATNPAGGIALAGNISASGISFQAGTGGIVQTAGSLGFAALANTTVTGGDVTLTQPANALTSLSNVTVTNGSLTLVNAGALGANTVSADNIVLQTLLGNGNLSAANLSVPAGGTIQLRSGLGISLLGTVSAPGTGVVDLSAAFNGVFQNNFGAITAGTLRSTAGITGNVDLANAANSIATVGDIAVSSGSFTLGSTAAVTVAGTVGANSITISDASDASAAIDVAGTLRANPGGVIVLLATGGIALSGTVDASNSGLIDLSAGSPGVTQTAGLLAAGTLQSSSGIAGTTTLAQAGNTIATLGKTTQSAGDLTLATSLPLTVAGSVAVSAGNLALTSSAPGAALVLAGPVDVSGTARLAATDPTGGITLSDTLKANTLDLFAGTGGVTQTGGALTLKTLQASGLNGSVSLAQPLNSIGTIGGFILDSGDASLATTTALTIAGTLKATQGDVIVTGTSAAPGAITVAINGTVASGPGGTTTLAAPNGGITVALGGLVSAPGGLADLSTATGIAAPGILAVGKLAVAASKTGDIALSGAQSIGTLASAVLANGNLEINNTVPLTITGPVTARLVRITAAGSLTLADGVVITTDGLSRANQGVTATLTDAQIADLTPTKLGTYFAVTAVGGAPGTIAIGDVTSAPYSAAQAVVDFVLPQPEAGTITIGQFAGPTTDLILVTRAGGITSGTVDVAGLLVVGNGGKADLFGKIGGVDGQAAANKANISPQPNSAYRFNACPITSVNCVLIPIQTVPPISPLRDVPLIRDRPTQDDADVQLPNVSDEDY